MIFTTKPCEIEAIQWTDNTKEILDFCGKEADYYINDANWEVGKGIPHESLIIHTLEGDMTASRNDFIIKGLRGEFYPCKPDVFVQKYEPKGMISDFTLLDFPNNFVIFNGKNDNEIQTLIGDYIEITKESDGLYHLKDGSKSYIVEINDLLIIIPKAKNLVSKYILLKNNEYIIFNNKFYIKESLYNDIKHLLYQLKVGSHV